jgi:hypothetical protein
MRESAAKILPTHEVTNQPPPLPSINLFEGDIALVEAVRRSGAASAYTTDEPQSRMREFLDAQAERKVRA